MVQEYGPELGTNVFQRLRHVEGGELWELRTNGHPAYRALLAPIAGGSAYVLLDVVAKAELAKDPEKYIIQALFYLDRWLTEVYENENRSDGADDI